MLHPAAVCLQKMMCRNNAIFAVFQFGAAQEGEALREEKTKKPDCILENYLQRAFDDFHNVHFCFCALQNTAQKTEKRHKVAPNRLSLHKR